MNLSKIKIILFVTVLILPTILWIALGVAAPSLRSELDYDLGEKRDKTEVSSIAELSGSGTVLSDYFADRAPFRSILITTYQKAETALESAYEKGIKPAAMAMIYGSGTTDVKTASGDAYEQLFAESETPVDETVSGDGTSGESAPEVAEPAKHIHDYVITATVEADYDTYGYTEYICSECGETRIKWQDKLVDNSYLAPDVRNSVTIIGRREWLFLYGYGNIPYYQATNLLTEEEMAEYAQKLQTLKDLCDDRGITLAVLFVPNKDQVYSEYMPSFQVEDEYKRVARLTDYLNENTTVPVSYPIDELIYIDRYWRSYYKYDTHWNSLGAYIGVQALYSKLGMEVTDPLTLEIASYDRGAIGDLLALGGLDASQYSSDVGYVIPYKLDVPVTYETNGNVETTNIYRTESDCGNDLQMVLLGDSYRCAMIEFLKKDFSRCLILHRDYIESVRDDLLSADVIVLQAAERYDTRIFNSVDYLIELYSNN